MQRASWLAILLVLAVGCAGSEAARSTTAAPSAAEAQSTAAVAALTRKHAEQQKRIAELEARLSLLESEARRQRGSAALPTETIRIRERKRESVPDEAPALESVEPEPEQERHAGASRGARERVPTLRLYGLPPSAAREGLADVPEGAPALPVVPLPEERAGALAATSASDAVKREYKEALRLLRERRYDESLQAFERFVADHPADALVGHALYWRGEAHYAKREYRLARESFEALLSRYADSEKAADSMLKVGLCLRRLGDDAEAKVYFRRVQEKFPNTQAAQVASREGST